MISRMIYILSVRLFPIWILIFIFCLFTETSEQHWQFCIWSGWILLIMFLHPLLILYLSFVENLYKFNVSDFILNTQKDLINQECKVNHEQYVGQAWIHNIDAINDSMIVRTTLSEDNQDCKFITVRFKDVKLIKK